MILQPLISLLSVPLNTFTTERNDATGEAWLKLSSQNELDANVGSTDFGGSVKTDEGVEMVITNEPAIRMFDGQKYSENLATDRIMGELQKLNSVYAASYDPINGFIFWGSDA